jgi:hypothetical protein
MRRPASLRAFARLTRLTRATLLSAILVAAGPALAATRTMVGALGVLNPDVGSGSLFEAGPGAFGKKFGPHPPTAGVRLVDVPGAAGTTAPGRAIPLPAGVFDFQGAGFRDFPAFSGIAQVTKTFMTHQPAASFMNGGGALAACPGPGCVASGMGTEIGFCPPLEPNPLAPPPGTAMAPIGNWQCTSHTAAGPGRRGIRLAISNSSNGAKFGGTLSLLRTQRATIWRVVEPPATPMALAVVERAWRAGPRIEAAGGPAFGLQSLPENNGPQLLARLDAREAVTATFGCANGLGTIGIGKTFMFRGPNGPHAPITGLGQGCGTAPGPGRAGHVLGFPLTTGTLTGSDFFPALDATTALGTPFQPRVVPRSFAQGLFFTRMGGDAAPAAQTRQLTLIGGGIAYDAESGHAFFRVTDLRLLILVPEPETTTGALFGVAAIAALAFSDRRRARSREKSR